MKYKGPLVRSFILLVPKERKAQNRMAKQSFILHCSELPLPKLYNSFLCFTLILQNFDFLFTIPGYDNARNKEEMNCLRTVMCLQIKRRTAAGYIRAQEEDYDEEKNRWVYGSSACSDESCGMWKQCR